MLATSFEAPSAPSASVSASAAATIVRRRFREAGVAAIHIAGSPGSGKTSLIERTVQRLGEKHKLGIIVCHPSANRDACKLARLGVPTFPVSAINIDAPTLHRLVTPDLLARLDLLLIESVGPDLQDVGQTLRVAMFSATGGHDKAFECPCRVKGAAMILLSKADLLKHVEFDMSVFRDDVTRLNVSAPLVELALTTGAGVNEWIVWLQQQMIDAKVRRPTHDSDDLSPEWWYG